MGAMEAEDRGPQVAATAILFLILTWVFVSLRCYVRAFMTKSFGLDDWFAVGSLILFSLYCTFCLAGVRNGTGQHLANIPPSDIPIALKWWWCCELAYVSSAAVLKLSIGVFLLRICVKRAQIITIWVVMVVVMVFSTFYFFVVIFQCSPVDYFWTQYLGAKGTCVSPTLVANATYAASAVHAWADWTLGILPIFLVWNLAMTPRTKMTVAFILALGAIGSAATIIRIPYISQLTETNDFLYTTTDVAIWSTVEPGIGITAAAIATLRPLFRHFLSRSRLFGGSSPHGASGITGSNAWGNQGAHPTRAGYFRKTSNHANDIEELGLRSDVKHSGITTIIETGDVVADDSPQRIGRRDSTRALKGVRGWNHSDSKLADDSSEDQVVVRSGSNEGERSAKWGDGITKTMEVRTQAEQFPPRNDEARRF